LSQGFKKALTSLAFATLLVLSSTAPASAAAITLSPIATVSAPCSNGSNAEVEQAVDPNLHYVYEEWMGSGCGGIAFARSTDGGLHFSDPISMAGSVGSTSNSWDPSLAVGPDGTVYAAFMRSQDSKWFPVVAASFDHGQTFTQVSSLVPPVSKNWGDRDFIAVGPDGTVYVTWDFGPQRTSVTFICASGGSCAFLTGDLNVVIQWSKDHGKTWSQIVPISPGFPASGGDSAPLLVEPSGRIDVLYQGYHITNDTTFTMNPANSFFTSSTDGGRTWSPPVLIGPADLTMSLSEWWIDGAIARDASGTLYATWDTQGANADIGWLSFSRDGGQHWSPLVRVTPDNDLAPHIIEVTGGGNGVAYVSWLSSNATQGYAEYLRTFSVSKGLGPVIRVSSSFGDPSVWPGDTTGISSLSSTQVVVSWGSAIQPTNQPKSQIFARVIDFSEVQEGS
jgi:hypothetical protein